MPVVTEDDMGAPESDDDAPTMPPAPLPDGPIVELIAVDLRNDPRAE